LLLLLCNCSIDKAGIVAGNIQTEFKNKIQSHLSGWDKSDQVSLSMGLLSSLNWPLTPNEIINRADLTIYHAKRDGKGKTSVYSEINSVTDDVG